MSSLRSFQFILKNVNKIDPYQVNKTLNTKSWDKVTKNEFLKAKAYSNLSF